MINLSGDFNASVRRENIFKPTTGNERLCHNNNNNNNNNNKGFRIVKFDTSKQVVRARFTRTADPVLMGRPTTRLITY